MKLEPYKEPKRYTLVENLPKFTDEEWNRLWSKLTLLRVFENPDDSVWTTENL